MFSGSDNLIAPPKRLLRPYFETGSDKFKMAAAKTGLPVSQLLHKTAKNSNCCLHVSGVRELNNAVGKVQYRNISDKQDGIEIPEANRMFMGSGNSMALLVMLYLKTGSQKFKMAALTRKYLYLRFYTRWHRNSRG
jgi:hypothetical protein